MANDLSSNNNNSGKDFASVLNGSNAQNESIFENKKNGNAVDNKIVEEDSKESKSDSKKEKAVNEEKNDKSESDSKKESEKDRSTGNVQVNSHTQIEEFNTPNARSILHVVDLERIISKIRSLDASNGKQIVIELKESVFQGLKMKLTIGKDKSVIAEFIAANENVKSQLNSRTNELSDLLQNRGVKLSKLQMSLDTQNDDNQHKEQNPNEFLSDIKSSQSSVSVTKKNLDNTHTDISYQA